ncbi:RecA-superfamily ATPase possibly involved in signal transduction [Caldisphaera lagunensis DSM 15908]|uniref:RecA-superfamily ATPase possibly involved in signal transduction n=1 Tax=Caldisphaera lagunensis (strain DSM 15908 / JCM 11604 / ANMR 0165 / IC-154) TaxID=1056495 RepID=L0AA79_CALLD|nr:ATPase domain-containing protein [Caldisphaera lagunensis]AFZ69950.1 RecA-superfamily ATPase possibly involved in signal transduction [Caldisphaera lagunensis DSM 15908]
MSQTNNFTFGIEELDNLLNNIEQGNVILIAGNPGAGKTTFASKIAYENMKKYNSKTIYISFIEGKNEFFRNMKSLGLDFNEFENKGLFNFLEEITFTNKEMIPDLLNQFIDIIDKINAKILIIDSITSLIQLSHSIIHLREILHNFLYRISKTKGITSILIEEIPYGSEKIGIGIEEFLVDTIILLKAINLKGKIVRVAEIRKARRSNISLTTIPFIIKYDKAISLLYPKKFNRVAKHKIIKIVLDNNDFYIDTGSQNLIIVHPKINPFSLASLIILGTLIGTPSLLENIRRKLS